MQASGLIAYEDKSSVPLKEVYIRGKVWGGFAEITINQVYQNTGKKNIEAIYTFPVPDSATVTGFQAEIADRKITGVIKEKEEAFKEYDSAVRAGNSAVLLEEYRPNIFQVSVGQILTGETVKLEISYLDELKRQDNEQRLLIPTVVAPRYIPGIRQGEHLGMGGADPTDLVPDADFITPPLGSVDYTVSLDLEVVTLQPAEYVSPSHQIKVEQLTPYHSKISLAEGRAEMDRDFILNCTYVNELQAAGMQVGEGNKEKLLYLTFLPELEALAEYQGKNYTFLLDISGSMDGIKLKQAKSALQLCLRNLCDKDSFNIIAFNHACKFYSQRQVPFNQANLDEASRWINRLEASGGTEILEAIEFALKAGKHQDNVILLFTDGQVGNEQQIFNFVSQNLYRNRIFSFGIDTAVNSYFINKLAELGGGRPEFVYPGERIDDKVLRQFARIISPVAEEVKINWGGLKVIDSFPQTIDHLYDLEPVTVFARVIGEITEPIMLQGKVGDKDFTTAINPEAVVAGGSESKLLEKIWAKRRLEQLEEDLDCGNPRRQKGIKAKIIELSKQHGIMSRLTSLVAVEERVEKASGLPLTQVVPVTVPKNWEMFNRINSRPYASIGDSFCFLASPNVMRISQLHEMSIFNTESNDSPDSLTCEDSGYELLHSLAARQRADGSFGDKDDLACQLETTATAILAFLLSDEDLTVYRKQLAKAVKFVLENWIPEMLDVHSNDLVKTFGLLILCLKAAVKRGIVRGKDRTSVEKVIDSLKVELGASGQDLGEEVLEVCELDVTDSEVQEFLLKAIRVDTNNIGEGMLMFSRQALVATLCP